LIRMNNANPRKLNDRSQQVTASLLHIGFIIILPVVLLIEGVSLLWKLAFDLPLPLYMCKDPEMRKRAHILMLGATAGLHGCHGAEPIVVERMAAEKQ
jgi:hypothetical protein